MTGQLDVESSCNDNKGFCSTRADYSRVLHLHTTMSPPVVVVVVSRG